MLGDLKDKALRHFNPHLAALFQFSGVLSGVLAGTRVVATGHLRCVGRWDVFFGVRMPYKKPGRIQKPWLCTAYCGLAQYRD